MWGDSGVTKRLLLSSGAVAWGTGGQPIRIDVPQTGILRALRLLSTGTGTGTPGTGTVAVDKNGPFNLYSRFRLTPNSQAPIVDVTGYGLALINDVISVENTPDTTLVTVQNAEPAADNYNFPSTGTGTLNYWQVVPVAQKIRSLGGEVGLFPLQNPAVQLSAYWTPNSASTATPYNIYSTTAGASPYLVTGPATVTLASPTLDIVRDLWEVPQSQADYPPFQFVSSWTEETPQGGTVVGATQITWKATPLSGILVRVIGYLFDGGTNNGIAVTSLTASNAVSLLYNSTTAKFSETGSEAQSRQRDFFNHDLPLGAYCYDLLGEDLTLQDALNTFTVANIQMQFNVASAMASGSSAKILRQMIMPLMVN